MDPKKKFERKIEQRRTRIEKLQKRIEDKRCALACMEDQVGELGMQINQMEERVVRDKRDIERLKAAAEHADRNPDGIMSQLAEYRPPHEWFDGTPMKQTKLRRTT